MRYYFKAPDKAPGSKGWVIYMNFSDDATDGNVLLTLTCPEAEAEKVRYQLAEQYARGRTELAEHVYGELSTVIATGGKDGCNG